MRLAESLGPLWLGQTRRARWARAAIVSAALVVLVSAVAEQRFIEVLELKTQDLRYRARGARAPHPDVVLVEIDDLTLETYDDLWPLPRRDHAILSLGAVLAGATGVGLDLVFDSEARDKVEDLQLERFLKAPVQGSTLGAHLVLASHLQEFGTRQTGPIRSVPELEGRSWPVTPEILEFRPLVGSDLDLPIDRFIQDTAVRLGHISPVEESDGSIRRFALLMQYQDRLFPAFSLIAWLQHQGLDVSDVEFASDPPRLRNGETDLLQIPDRATWEIDYYGNERIFDGNRVSYIDAINLAKVALGKDSPEKDKAQAELRATFQGKYAIVGLTAASSYSLDLGVTPFNSSTPGMYVHANLLSNLMHAKGVQRLPTTQLILLAGLLLLVGNAVGPRVRVGAWLGLSLAILLMVGLSTQLAFNLKSIIVPTIAPLLVLVPGTLVVAALTFVGQEGERRTIKNAFGRYVSPELLDGIIENAGRIELGGATHRVTVLFLDIRGFTAWANTMDPQNLVDELNAFLKEMVGVVFRYEGSVNKFLGDAILAVFGAPVKHEDDADRAISAAAEMYERLDSLNDLRAEGGKEPIRMGIGIATGAVVAGNMGSSERMEYTVIGNAVNLSSRLQSLSQDGEILMDPNTVSAANGIQYESLGIKPIKGFENGIEVFSLKRPDETPTS